MKFFSQLFGKPKDTTEQKAPEAVTDAVHINQEMYKKSVELSERNKTLALLQRINEVILSSITHPEEIARIVTSLLVSHIDFQIVSIFLHEKQNHVLKRIACSEIDKQNSEDNQTQKEMPYFTEISLSQQDNLIVKAVTEAKLQISFSLGDILLPANGLNTDIGTPIASNTKTVFIYPLMVRSESIGAMVIGLKEEEQSLSEFRKDLLNSLAETIGIGLDNALLYNEVQSTNEQLKKMDKLKNEFVSLTSHELRTPMTAIASYLAMTLDGQSGPLTEQQRYLLTRSTQVVQRLVKMVNDMLNISRIESGRLSFDVKSVSLEQLAQEIIEEVTPRSLELGVTISMEHSQLLPLVIADPDKIKEVLFNLIGNALKFTPKGGTITISFAQKDTVIETIVSDSGIGIAADNLSKLFQKFDILPGSYKENPDISGTGLGLYISKSIIELHEGKIWAESEGQGKGTKFIFSLRVFNDQDFKRLSDKYASNIKEGVDLIHTKV